MEVNRKLMCMCLMLLALASCINATDSEICKIERLGLIVIALFAAMAMVLVAYLLGTYMKNPKFIAWAKMQAGTIVVTIILVAVIIGTFFAVCSYLPAGEVGFHDGVYNWLEGLEQNSHTTVQRLIRGSFEDQFEATAYWFVGYPIIGGAGASHTAYRLAVSAEREMVVNYATMFSLSMALQKIIMLFLEAISLNYLLPVAIVIRMFPGVKEIGNFLIALSIGFILIYPSAYAVFMQTDSHIGIINGIDTAEFKPYDISLMSDISLTGKYLYFAIFMPNFVLVIVSTFVVALYTALKDV